MNKLKLYSFSISLPVIGLFIISLLAGCAGLPTIPATNAQAAPRVTLTPCTISGVAAECGYLQVPEDRSKPDGRVLDLKLVVVRAYGPESGRQPDPLFYIVGGPGVPVTRDDIVNISRNYIFWKVNAQRDLVFLDQRGTNDKHRLTCEPLSVDIISASQQQVDDWLKQCLANMEGDPRFYTTVPAMQDLDQARAALGYDKINLYGISYGAAAAQVYMRMFPGRVRTVVMDHGTALDQTFVYLLPRVSQMALDQVFTYCEQDEKCRAAYPDIRGDFKAVIGRLAKGPVVTSYTPPGAPGPGSVTSVGLADALHDMMYQGDYGKIPFLIHILATTEDWTQIAKSYNEQQQKSSSEDDNKLLLMAHMIFCFEPAWGTDPNEVARFSPGSYYLENELAWTKAEQRLCAALPKPDPALIYGPAKPAPLSVLMFNSLLDPQNPPSNVDQALKEFTQSRVVVEPTEGHEPYAQHQCRWDIMAQYIEQGSADGLDTSCMEEMKPYFTVASQ